MAAAPDFALAQQAADDGMRSRLSQANNLKRAIPASRDPELCELHVTPALVREAEKVIDKDPGLVGFIEQAVRDTYDRPGRPAALSFRTALVCFWLLAVTHRSFQLINLPALIANMEPKTRRRLGIDYLDSQGQGRQISYSQLWTAFTNVADALDPFADTLTDDEEAAARALSLQEGMNRLTRSSVWNTAHKGDYAVDATLVWSWDRPPRSSNKKIERRGRDGDAGRPVPLSSVIELDQLSSDALEDAGLVEDPLTAIRATIPKTTADEKSATAEPGAEAPPDPFAPLPGPGGHIPAPPRRTKRRPATWGRGAAWVGRGRNKQKSVFGYALHTMSATDPSQPPVIEAAALTPAPALPAPAVVPLLRHLHDVRLADPKVAQALSEGNARILGNIVADPAYTINVDRWQLPIRALGADAIFRLHATMQAGRKTVRGAVFVDGRPYCRCIPDTLARLRYPKFPFNSTTVDRRAW